MVTLLNDEQAVQYLQQQLQHLQLERQQVDAIFQYAIRNQVVSAEKLAALIYSETPIVTESMQSIYVFQVDELYYIETIYSVLEQQCERKFLYNAKALFQQYSLHSIVEPFHLLQLYIEIASKHFNADLISTKLLDLLHHFQHHEKPSNRLKMAEIVILLYFYQQGERYYNYVLRDIARIKRTWKRGKLALTTKERTLLAYIAMTIAHSREQWKKVVDEVRYSLKQDRFMDVAIELIIDYEKFLSVTPPEPAAMIKNYRTSLFENLFFMYLDALTQLDAHEEAMDVLMTYEIASTTTIFEYLQKPSEDALVAIEASMQQNIAYLVDQSVSYVKQSLQKWQDTYSELPEAHISSKYMCILLETLFINGQYELFDRMMSMYVKYIKFEHHYDCLKQRISVHMALQS